MTVLNHGRQYMTKKQRRNKYKRRRQHHQHTRPLHEIANEWPIRESRRSHIMGWLRSHLRIT